MNARTAFQTRSRFRLVVCQSFKWIYFLSHAKPVDETQQTSSGSIWYLPHHGVVNSHKPGKLRVVFNPSSRHKRTSLSKQLFKSPDLLTSLIGVLFRFRRLPVPISEDIQKMYHQVLVTSHQQSFLCFLWENLDHVGEPKSYQMTVHIFGAVSSPTNCIYALRKTGEYFGARYPLVADRILHNIYVDTDLDLTETEEEAI